MEILYPYSWWKKINLAASVFMEGHLIEFELLTEI